MNVICSHGLDEIPFKVLLENYDKLLPFTVLLFNQIPLRNFSKYSYHIEFDMN